MAQLLIIGASRGLGAAFSAGVPNAGDKVLLVSRSRPHLDAADGIERQWIKADLLAADVSDHIAAAIADRTLDVLIYNAGIWEGTGFTADYDFEQIAAEETRDIITVNLTAAIICIQKLLPSLRRSANAKIILIGSTSGLDNTATDEIAYAASKFGLRGLAQALRRKLRVDGIAVTCINPGEIAAEVPYESGADAAIAQYGGTRLPVQDLVAVVRCIISLSAAACVREIDLPAITDPDF